MEGAPNPASSASSVASAGSNNNNGRANTTTGGDFQLGMFGHGVGDLGGASAFGASLTNGYVLETTDANKSIPLDMSDFPSLDGGSGAAAAANQNGLAAALRQQQQLLAQQQRQLLQGTTSISSPGGGGGGGSSDGAWPALPGAPPVGRTNGGSSPFVLRNVANENAAAHDNNNKSPIVSRASSGSGGAFYSSGADDTLDGGLQPSAGTTLSQLQHQQRSSTPSSAGATSAASSQPGGGSSTLSREYGLLGLLSLIRMPDSDRKALALGTDLTNVGLLDNSSSKEPHYQLPMCYYVSAPTLKTGHFSTFQLETLFYIFYGLPKDALQAYAAQELYGRGWRYHVELELWFKEVGPADGINVSAGNGPQYMYFDINSWERRLCGANMMSKNNIVGGFLPEEETRVKYQQS